MGVRPRGQALGVWLSVTGVLSPLRLGVDGWNIGLRWRCPSPRPLPLAVQRAYLLPRVPGAKDGTATETLPAQPLSKPA